MIIKQELENNEIVESQRVLGANNEFMRQTKQYGGKDALLAFILFFVEILGLY